MVDARESRPRNVVGPMLVIAGIAIFVGSVFLPIYSILGHSQSFFDAFTQNLGRWPFLFGAALVTAAAALMTLAGRDGFVNALAVGAAAWFLTWIGLLIGVWGAYAHSIANIESGFWGMVAGLAVGFVGAVIAVIADRRRSGPIQDGA